MIGGRISESADASIYQVTLDSGFGSRVFYPALAGKAASFGGKLDLLKAGGMGKLMMAIGGLFVPAARESVEMMYEFEKPFVVDSSRFERVTGVKATPIADAIRATVAWYRAHPAGK